MTSKQFRFKTFIKLGMLFILLPTISLIGFFVFKDLYIRTLHPDEYIHNEGVSCVRSGSNLDFARGDTESLIRRTRNYINSCKQFPLNIKDTFNSGPDISHCAPPSNIRGMYTSSLDPWGRPYQVRYHKDRVKLQVRTLGRHIDNSKDDIVREDNLEISEDILSKEIEKCKKLPSDDKNCVFNRGWH